MSEGSDLDFIAVTERPPTQEQKEHLIVALLQLEREAPAKGLEMSVALLRDCRGLCLPHALPAALFPHAPPRL